MPSPHTFAPIKAACAPASRRGTSSIDNGVLNEWRTAAFIAFTFCIPSLSRIPHEKDASRYVELLGTNAAQEKLHCALHPVGQFVRPREIHRPLPHHGVVEPFHELR